MARQSEEVSHARLTRQCATGPRTDAMMIPGLTVLSSLFSLLELGTVGPFVVLAEELAVRGHGRRRREHQRALWNILSASREAEQKTTTPPTRHVD